MKDKKGEERRVYYHEALAGAVVKPVYNKVLPLAPEVIRNEDVSKKQDCEVAVGKRCFSRDLQTQPNG